MKVLLTFLGGHHKIGLYLGVIDFYVFYGLFLRSLYRMGIFLGVAKMSNIFGGCLKFLIFFRGESRCWARAYA